MRHAAAIARILLLIALCLVSPALKAESGDSSNITAIDAGWLKTIREGGSSSRADISTLQGFLSRTLRAGKTTLEDVTTLFGEPDPTKKLSIVSLDHPARDGVESRQYPIFYSDSINNTILVLTFDTKTKLLLTFDISRTMCGFCPHVFSHDGSWRLEGKMLANRVGSANHGADTMVLPRLISAGGVYKVKLSNLAPEIEHLSSARLATVPLENDEELDMRADGELTVWQPVQEISLGQMTNEVSLPVPPGSDLLVLELTNTGAFEQAMRDVYLDGEPLSRRTSIQVRFDGGAPVEVSPVGTKFLRRVAVKIPRAVQDMRITCDAELWHSRRLWFGQSRGFTSVWLTPIRFQPLRLAINDEAVLEFALPPLSPTGKLGHALRLEGYYEFTNVDR